MLLRIVGGLLRLQPRVQPLPSLWTRSISTTTPFPEFEGDPGINTHDDLYRFSLEKSDLFWGKLARSRLTWFQDFTRVQDCDMHKGVFKWFIDGKINASVNCVDRHLATKSNQVALIWEKDEPGTQEYVTYRELSDMVNKLGNVLRQHGVQKGDRVAIYLPISPMAVAAMLACTRIGAIHTVVFAGFRPTALADRINAAKASTVITADQAVRGGKLIELKAIADEAVAKCPTVKNVFVYARTGASKGTGGKMDIPLEQVMEQASTKCDPAVMDSEELLFMLYTSGSTGQPKGIAHAQGGYLLYANVTFKHVFDYREGEIFGCLADIGWITGHSYIVYGPLSNGATTLLFESTPAYPNYGRYWEVVERLKLNHVYLAPTALRSLLMHGDLWVTKYDRSSVRKLGSVGEPLNHEAFEWYYNVVGEKRCDVVDTWWQTETGGIAIAPRPSEVGAEIRAAMPMRPFFGIEPILADKVTEGDSSRGALCLGKPWPGMARTIYGDHERFLKTYYQPYPGLYFTGDGACCHEGKYYQITGRTDDVLNISGHLLGTAEIEDILCEHEAVAEAAVVGYPHDIKGEGVYAYVSLKDGVTQSTDEIREELRVMVKKEIAGYAMPDYIQVAPGLPKTRSGKIMRRILRKVAVDQFDDLGDISTLADPSVVEAIISNHLNMTKTGGNSKS